MKKVIKDSMISVENIIKNLRRFESFVKNLKRFV